MRHNSGGCYPTICIFSHILSFFLHMHFYTYVRSYVCVCIYRRGDFDCQNNLCVIFADRRQIRVHTHTHIDDVFIPFRKYLRINDGGDSACLKRESNGNPRGKLLQM